jgi:hypothetical protein
VSFGILFNIYRTTIYDSVMIKSFGKRMTETYTRAISCGFQGIPQGSGAQAADAGFGRDAD